MVVYNACFGGIYDVVGSNSGGGDTAPHHQQHCYYTRVLVVEVLEGTLLLLMHRNGGVFCDLE